MFFFANSHARIGLVAASALIAFAAAAQTGPVPLDIAAQPLDKALGALARQSGARIVFSTALTESRPAAALQGRFTVQEALARLLAGTGLTARALGEGGFTVMAPEPGTSVVPGSGSLSTVTVTASPEGGSEPPPPYAGGQVARGGRLGLLGNQSLMDTPFNTASYTAQTMQDQQARSIADVVANDPSVRNLWSASSYTGPLVMRGFSVSNQDVAFDGLYGIAPALMVSTDFVERVEVLKGPNALLSGMAPFGSVGGGINVVPKRAGDEPLTRWSLNYASDRQFGSHLDLGRRFGPDNAVGVRFNASYRDGDTAVDRQKQALGTAVLGLDWRGERVRLSADLGYQKQDFDAPLRPTYVAPGSPVPRAPRNTNNWFQPWGYVNTRDTFGVLRGEVDLAEHWTAYAAYGMRAARFDGLTGFANGAQFDGRFSDAESYFPSYTDSRTGELGVRGRLRTGSVGHELALSATRLALESGSLFSTVATVPSNLYFPVLAPKPFYTPRPVPRTSETSLSSVALADTLSMLDDRVRLTLGVRRQKVDVTNYNATTGLFASRYDKQTTTPAVGLVVKPWEHVSFYGNYIEGLQQGTTAPQGTRNAGEVFPLFKSKQYELGAKVDFGRFTTTASLFQIRQPSGLTDPATMTYSVDGEQRNRGLEINVFGEAAPGLRVLGGVMFTDGRLTRTANGSNDGKTATGVPRTQVNLGAEWDTAFLGGLTLSARAIYTSGQFLDAANTQRVPAWTRLDVGARYAMRMAGRPLVLRANIENLFNRSYWASAGSTFGLSPGAPRTFLLSATVDF